MTYAPLWIWALCGGEASYFPTARSQVRRQMKESREKGKEKEQYKNDFAAELGGIEKAAAHAKVVHMLGVLYMYLL